MNNPVAIHIVILVIFGKLVFFKVNTVLSNYL